MINIFTWRALIALVLSVLFYFFMSIGQAQSQEEDADKAVQNALLKRTLEKCDLILPAWLTSENGAFEEDIRHLLVDCYTGHARLHVIGVETDFPISETSLVEIPAVLIREETGMDLDIYRPLAGKSLAPADVDE